MRLDVTGEDELIRRLVALVPVREGAGTAPGDDCAVRETGDGVLLLKTDALVERVHFGVGEKGRRVGWKAVARVMSDFAAMGGRADDFLVTLALPGETEVEWVEEVYRGMAACMARHGGVLAGGETCRVPEGSARVISVAATGRAHKGEIVLRSGGRPGDVLMVTGVLGGSLAGRHLDFEPRVAEGKWLARRGSVRAMMDLSDGLAKDLSRLAEASGCGFILDREAVPRNPGCSLEEALTDGEDFELLIAVDPSDADALLAAWEVVFPALSLRSIGSLVERGRGEMLSGGWDHFGAREP